ncbi:MFS transporter [Pacificispira spongiicola]|uniref:MFS transporter n=1 Tax=Pacificispira spongiicola TaxID=2729598 RepID=UPI001D0C1EE9|nr:MFS transporter [Pacificispira spongiicola]
MSPILAVGAIINGIVLLQLGMGLLSALLPLRMADAGFASSEIGILAAGFSGGFLVGCIYAPRLVRRIGHIRAFSTFATILSALTLALAIDTDLFLWTAARLLSGFCFAGLLTISDSWISSETDRSVRGRVMSVYMILYKLAQAAGPLILTVAAIHGNWHFMLVSALFSLCLVPVALRHGGNPTPPSNARMGLVEVYRTTPLAVVGCLCVATSNSALANLIPLYGVSTGLGVAGAAILSSALQLGALFLQWPMGWASDKTDRRVVMIFGIAAMAAVSATIALLPPMPLPVYIILIGITGGFGFSIYPIIVAHAGDFVEPAEMVPLCATLMLAFSFGMTIGPLTGSFAMDLLGPKGLFLHAIVFSTIFVIFALYRMSRRAAPVTLDRSAYVNVPASSTAISQLDPRSPGPEIDETLEEAFGSERDEDERPHYRHSEK